MFDFFFDLELFDFADFSAPVASDADVAIDAAVPPLTGVVEVFDAPADAIGPFAQPVSDDVTPAANTGAANVGAGVVSDLVLDPASLADDTATAECTYCQLSDVTLDDPAFILESSNYGSDYFFS